MLECMVKYNVPILTASDAHSPQNVGLYIKEMNDLIQSIQLDVTSDIMVWDFQIT
ncbi:MAG: hypothetical protein K2L82_16825 [Lachnospiraceae bacterium]|nr:hypothetical protein [Lachnospiraceae bacterium]